MPCSPPCASPSISAQGRGTAQPCSQMPSADLSTELTMPISRPLRSRPERAEFYLTSPRTLPPPERRTTQAAATCLSGAGACSVRHSDWASHEGPGSRRDPGPSVSVNSARSVGASVTVTLKSVVILSFVSDGDGDLGPPLTGHLEGMQGDDVPFRACQRSEGLGQRPQPCSRLPCQTSGSVT